VKLIDARENSFEFHITPREKQLLIGALHLYPLLNPDFHQVTRTQAERDEKLDHAQQLLVDAMAERKAELKGRVRALLEDAKWVASESWILTAEDIEWLLQVINDVRVGSWVLLGRPDVADGRTLHMDENNIHYAIAMEICGVFETILLEALHRE